MTEDPECVPSGATIHVVAEGNAFEKVCYAAPASQAFTVELINEDAVTHNFLVFGRGATFFTVLAESGETVSEEVPPLAEGTYTFECAFHASQMNGVFVVARAP